MARARTVNGALVRGAHGAAARGAVAQLGERLVRNEEVRGSIPLGSTTRPDKPDDITTIRPVGRASRGAIGLLSRDQQRRGGGLAVAEEPAAEEPVKPCAFGNVIHRAPGKVIGA